MSDDHAAELGHTEWQAISIGLQDALTLSFGIAPGQGMIEARLRRFASRLAGQPPLRPLANPRLEALREYACSARCGQPAAGDNRRALLALGFDEAQVEAITSWAERQTHERRFPCRPGE